jgi:rubredoxin
MDRTFCLACGFILDPEVGYADLGIMPATTLADLPENWKCPVCGAGKIMYVLLEENQREVAARHRHMATVSAWKCLVCNYIQKGTTQPEKCPVCEAAAFFVKESCGQETTAD